MTLDDLTTAYNSGYWSCYEGQHRAGIRAVVGRLREEIMTCTMLGYPQYLVKLHVQMAFNEILGSDAGEKAAGTDTAAKPEVIERSTPAADHVVSEAERIGLPKQYWPAADPSPAVCECWGNGYAICRVNYGGGIECSVCGKQPPMVRRFMVQEPTR